MEKLAGGSAADPENPAPTIEMPEIDESANSSQPSQNQNDDHSTSGNRNLYHHPKYSILRKAALNGVWEEAKNLLEEDPLMLAAVITDGDETALHVATGASQTFFVTEIIRQMEPEYLEMRDGNENTAFTIAAIAGNIEIATVLLEKNPELLKLRDSKGMTPLHLAVLLGKNEMAMFLYHISIGGYLTFEDRTELFFQSIKSGLYGQEMIKSTSNQEPTPALQLLNHLWNEAKQNFVHVKEQITKPSNLLFDAARLGNSTFLNELIHSYPSLVHELDEMGRTIFHVAILHRQTSVFDLIHKIGFRKEIIGGHVDLDDNTILHLAAKYSKQSPESGLSSAALQMQNELILFEVKSYHSSLS
ncbi:hypothetical protein LWI29_025330 [Acer saccharum]|uniref:Uncharacterized protein n=1 Tax=Acer saccharum TaxID=4024 RepID=A0AA39TVE8_ACESA|nr:hypothetical protein LWI29_025330 [Acer saccharum]